MRAIVSLALLAWASSALAQRDNSDEQYGRPAMTPENQIDMSLGRFVFCAQQTSQAAVAKVLAAPLASEDEARAVHKLALVNRDCSSGRALPFTPTAVRNALATIAYRRDHRTDVPPATPAGTPPPASFAVVPPGTTGSDQQEAAWFLGAVANCVVFLDPPGVHRLVTGPIDVPEEEKRFAALGTAVGRCSPAGAPTLNARILRGYLANALLTHVGSGAKRKG